jgi:hypothetical protein
LQIDIPYTLVGPDGTRCVFNDPSDPDYIGRLDAESGITGLDSPEVRESADVLVEDDGGIHGNFFHGRRPVVLQGWIHPDPISEANRRMDRLLRASNAMRADATLTWTETGSDARTLFLRRQQPARITGRRPKTFMLALVQADSRIYSAAVNTQVISAAGGASLGGLASPVTSPLQVTGGGGLGAAGVVNRGTVESPAVLRIDGPITNPVIRNATAGQDIRLTYTLHAGEYLIVDLKTHTVLLNGTTDRYSALDFTNSSWWKLQPGVNDIHLLAAAYSIPAAVTVTWRHAWI